MTAIRRRDTAPEIEVRRRLHAMGLRYRVDWSLPFDRRRKADVAFTRAKVVVFIDGCFWHACPEHYRAPTINPDYWAEKMKRNVARDRDTDKRLREAGWVVLRFWTHDDADEIAAAIEAAVRQVE